MPLAAKAVVAHVGHTALDAGLVLRPADARRIDDEAAGLRILEEGRDDARLQRIRLEDDDGRVVRDEDAEDAAVKRPRRLARLDGARRGLAHAGVDEAVARDAGREDPRAEAPPSSGGVGLEVRHPAGVERELLAGRAVGHGDRRGRPSDAEHRRRKAVEGRRRDRHALPQEEAANLRQSHPGAQARLDDAAMLLARVPARPVRALGGGPQRDEDRGDALLGERHRHHPGAQATALGRAQVPAHSLRVEPEPPRDLLAAGAGEPLPEHLCDLDHRDLPIRHHPSTQPLRAGRAVMVG
jgi:hypothetical protein